MNKETKSSHDHDLPIIRATYDAYQTFIEIRTKVAKQYKHTICERVELLLLGLLEIFYTAAALPRIEKLTILERESVKLNILRLLVRLMKDVHAIEMGQYARLQKKLDEIGRMLGGWIKSVRGM